MKILLSLVMLLLTTGCVSPAPAVRVDLPQVQESCEAAGHRWACRGVPGEGCPMICVAEATDAGQSCTHSDQCEGECLAANQHARSGTCSAKTNWPGCDYYLDDNRRAGGLKLCYD